MIITYREEMKSLHMTEMTILDPNMTFNDPVWRQNEIKWPLVTPKWPKMTILPLDLAIKIKFCPLNMTF